MRSSLAILLSALAALALAACTPGEGSCAICARSFTTAECANIAVAYGCASSETYQDTICQPATQGCRFHGCRNTAVQCIVIDGGADSGP